MCLLLGGAGFSAPPKSVSSKPVDNPRQEMAPQQVRDGLSLLRKYLATRGEEPAVADDFVDDLQRKLLGPNGDRRDPVTRGTFDAFMKFETAWARKTRDSKNQQVTAAELEHERLRSDKLKQAFVQSAQADSPRFFAAFRAAVKDVRTTHADLRQRGGAAGFFGNHVDDSYTKVDAGDEALDQGDPAAAAADADQAIAENPDNADAYALKSGAEYASGALAAAATDAQTALSLDPGNLPAQAIASLSAGAPVPAGTETLVDAASAGSTLANDSSGAPPPGLSSPAPTAGYSSVASLPSAVAAPPLAPIPAAPPSSLPVLSAQLSNDLTQRAARGASLDPAAAIGQLDRAIALNPSNSDALNWRAALSNQSKDYKSGLASAERAAAVNPRDGKAFYNKALALRGLGDRDGMIDALRQAAAIDPAFKSAADAAVVLPRPADEELLTQSWPNAAAQTPAQPPPRAGGWSESQVTSIFAAIGALLLALGLLLLRRKS